LRKGECYVKQKKNRAVLLLLNLGMSGLNSLTEKRGVSMSMRKTLKSINIMFSVFLSFWKEDEAIEVSGLAKESSGIFPDRIREEKLSLAQTGFLSAGNRVCSRYRAFISCRPL
jgi:hypothetical protein